ncbi:MAG: hypothetical protein RML56_03175 [Burkholderiales bacterium]|nr:hypothetical protein [Burkholderiales bacterium]
MSERTPPDLKTVGDFLRRFAFWNEERSQHRFAEFARGTSRLLVALRVIKDQWRETERLASQSFNIFRALRVECRETSHSAFLAELLRSSRQAWSGPRFSPSFPRIAR